MSPPSLLPQLLTYLLHPSHPTPPTINPPFPPPHPTPYPCHPCADFDAAWLQPTLEVCRPILGVAFLNVILEHLQEVRFVVKHQIRADKGGHSTLHCFSIGAAGICKLHAAILFAVSQLACSNICSDSCHIVTLAALGRAWCF